MAGEYLASEQADSKIRMINENIFVSFILPAFCHMHNILFDFLLACHYYIKRKMSGSAIYEGKP
jgi:hypothetical protein